MTTETTPAPISTIEDAQTSRWLNETLEPARARLRETPTAAAVDRIRDRVFGDAAPVRKDRSIAA